MPDPILLWNEVALEANRVSHTNGQGEQAGPPLSARALAIAHLAMYDAYAGCINNPKTLPLYYKDALQKKLPPSNTSPEGAVAVAASLTLSWLFPSQSPTFETLRKSITNDETSDAYKFGKAVFEAIQEDRGHDPGPGSVTYKVKLDRGKHRPDPDNVGQGFNAPDYGKLSKGFGIRTRFELAAPPFDDPANPYRADYLAALAQVRAKGIKPELMGALPSGSDPRTPGETLIGLYWGYDGALELGTPPRLYNQIIRFIALTKPNSATGKPNDCAENARLFAFVNVAMADAGMLAWEQKYVHELWRPVLGIREHDPSMGPGEAKPGSTLDGLADPLWLPLGAPLSNRIGKNFTPNFPAYPSGHATFGAAAFHITRLFYGQGGTFKGGDLGKDKLFDGLNFVSEELNGITTDNTGAVRPKHYRSFPDGLWQMIMENGLSRIYLGVHWVFDAFVLKDGKPELDRYVTEEKVKKFFGGVPLGLQIAEDIYDSGGGLAPVKSAVGPRPAVAPPTGRVPTYSSAYPQTGR